MLMICEERSCLFIEQTVSYNGPYAPKVLIFNSEFSDSVLLFDIVILFLHICNALLTFTARASYRLGRHLNTSALP